MDDAGNVLLTCAAKGHPAITLAMPYEVYAQIADIREEVAQEYAKRIVGTIQRMRAEAEANGGAGDPEAAAKAAREAADHAG